MSAKDLDLLGVNTTFVEDNTGLLAKHQQEIPRWHLDNLRYIRDSSLDTTEGDTMRIASIPVAIVEQWQREGFDIFDKNITPHEILNRLRNQDLDAFITTKKRV